MKKICDSCDCDFTVEFLALLRYLSIYPNNRGYEDVSYAICYSLKSFYIQT